MSEVTVITKLPSLNAKFQNMRMDNVFDSATITKAEGALAHLEHYFKTEIKRQYANLIATFAMTRPNTIQVTDTQKIADIAFSIKAQAGMAKMPLLSEVAKSLYELCSTLKEDVSEEVYKVIRLHIDAIIGVYENKFNSSNYEASQHLVRGLYALAKKYA